MKIMLCASFTFAKEMLDIKKKLEEQNHKVIINSDVEHYFENPEDKENYEKELEISKQTEALREAFENVAEADAILVINHDKNNIQGYLGTSVLMEIAIAYYLNKKIFLLNEIDKLQNYSLEIDLVKPIILNGNLDEIK